MGGLSYNNYVISSNLYIQVIYPNVDLNILKSIRVYYFKVY